MILYMLIWGFLDTKHTSITLNNIRLNFSQKQKLTFLLGMMIILKAIVVLILHPVGCLFLDMLSFIKTTFGLNMYVTTLKPHGRVLMCLLFIWQFNDQCLKQSPNHEDTGSLDQWPTDQENEIQLEEDSTDSVEPDFSIVLKKAADPTETTTIPTEDNARSLEVSPVASKIALRHSTRSMHLIDKFINYEKFTLNYEVFLVNACRIQEPLTIMWLPKTLDG